MRNRASLTTIAVAIAAAVVLGGTALAQTDIEQLQPAPRPGGALGTDQLTPGDVGDRTRVEQPQGGRDLCDPSVPESVRRRAGVDCELPMGGQPEQKPLAEKDLRTPEGTNLEDEFESFGLGKDVPPTFILQQ
tara:strand:+ start:607 stop:1005 length:399 start_codon:yes stop_codon:yes gene_type:complete